VEFDMNNKKLASCLLTTTICIYLFFLFVSTTVAKESKKAQTISPGMNLPQFMLNLPDSESEQKYLGLEEVKSFNLLQIPAKIIVLEIFSIYCPHCRLQAPELNKVYNFIKQDSELSNGIKMVGIAAGARKNEVAGWKKTLHVPFPLFPDAETTIWKKFGKPGVPCTLVVSGSGKVLAAHFGHTPNIEDFFCQVKKFYHEQR
jgi:peroxiredoxin